MLSVMQIGLRFYYSIAFLTNSNCNSEKIITSNLNTETPVDGCGDGIV